MPLQNALRQEPSASAESPTHGRATKRVRCWTQWTRWVALVAKVATSETLWSAPCSAAPSINLLATTCCQRSRTPARVLREMIWVVDGLEMRRLAKSMSNIIRVPESVRNSPLRVQSVPKFLKYSWSRDGFLYALRAPLHNPEDNKISEKGGPQHSAGNRPPCHGRKGLAGSTGLRGTTMMPNDSISTD